MDEFRRQHISNFPDRLLEKWPKDILVEGFVPLPKKLLRCAHRIFVGPEATKELSVVLAIVDFKRPNLSRHPSREFLAFLAGLERFDFDPALSRLEANGLIKVEEDGDELKIDLNGLLRRIREETSD